jgi:hypothetical protein
VNELTLKQKTRPIPNVTSPRKILYLRPIFWELCEFLEGFFSQRCPEIGRNLLESKEVCHVVCKRSGVLGEILKEAFDQIQRVLKSC